VAQVAAKLLEHVGSMDGEVNALVESLRAGAGRLAADLSAVEQNMGELYDAASGRAAAAAEAEAPRQYEAPLARAPEPEPEPQSRFESELDDALEAAPVTVGAGAQPGAAGGGDLDGARLIALNMALNGESRADTERYLAENFQLPDRLKLIDEVYSAIEG
jgi:hypothetical protein